MLMNLKKVAISLYSYNPLDIGSGVTLLRGIDEKRDATKVKSVDLSKKENVLVLVERL